MTFQPDFKKSLNKSFFLQDTATVARQLIGKALVKQTEGSDYLAGKIVEAEAYLSEGDLSSHSAPGLTKRNAPMFEEGGILYVYFIYGVHHCINIVTEPAGTGAAVLIRALEPLAGIEIMKKNRETDDIQKLCKGPGNVAKAFNFNLNDNRSSLTSEGLFIQDIGEDAGHSEISVTPRIGIVKSAHLPLRFYLENSPFVSGKKK